MISFDPYHRILILLTQGRIPAEVRTPNATAQPLWKSTEDDLRKERALTHRAFYGWLWAQYQRIPHKKNLLSERHIYPHCPAKSSIYHTFIIHLYSSIYHTSSRHIHGWWPWKSTPFWISWSLSTSPGFPALNNRPKIRPTPVGGMLVPCRLRWKWTDINWDLSGF